MAKKFTRNIENFTCDNCGQFVVGNGYTNHCPNCLYSKHVDINPGDRNCHCNGIMKPIESICTRHGYIIKHQCLKCGFIRNNKSSTNDNLNAILNVSLQKVKKY